MIYAVKTNIKNVFSPIMHIVKLWTFTIINLNILVLKLEDLHKMRIWSIFHQKTYELNFQNSKKNQENDEKSEEFEYN